MRKPYQENVYFRKRTNVYLREYEKQKNYCSRLYRKERKKFFSKLNPSVVYDNKLFWKRVKPKY